MLNAYVFAIISPRNNKLAPSLNFFGVGLYCCDVLQSLRKTEFKMSKSGQKQSQTKGRSNLPPLDTGSESNLIMFCRLQIGYVWTEVIRKKKLLFQMKTGTCEQRLNKQDSNASASNIFVHFSDVRARIRREILSSDVLRR